MNTFTFVYALACIGVIDTLYLIYHKVRGTDVACIFFPPEWCRKVQHSTYSKTFGIPNSIAGFVMYVLILALAYMAEIEMLSIWYVKGVVLFGFLFSLYFMYIQAFVLRAFCTWCVVSFINFSLLFTILYIL